MEESKQPNLRCKLFKYNDSNEWVSAGLGEARLDHFNSQWLAVFTREDGSEQGWDVKLSNDYNRNEQKVVRFFCTRSQVDHALSFQFEEGAKAFWE